MEITKAQMIAELKKSALTLSRAKRRLWNDESKEVLRMLEDVDIRIGMIRYCLLSKDSPCIHG
jgi:hypothetical protein